MKSQNAQLKVATSSKFKMAASILFRGLQFLCERENSVHQRSVVLRTGLQQTYLREISGNLRVCVREGYLASCFSSSLATEIRKFAAPFTSN